MRRFWSYLPAFVTVLLGMMIASPARANYTGWVNYGDRDWRIGADVYNPGNNVAYVSNDGGFTALVPHKGAYRNEVRRVGSTWGVRRYTVIGELSRYQGRNGLWFWYSDVLLSTYQPQYTTSTQSYYWFYNPQGASYSTAVPVAYNIWNQCDAEMTAYDHVWGSQRGPLTETHYYRTIPN